MNFEFNNDSPIYIQLVEQIKLYIISGKVKLGERLPSVRELSLKAKVNPNTLQKALMNLEISKLIYTDRTNGKYVTKDKKIIEKFVKEAAKENTKIYMDKMKKIGISEKEILNYLKMEGNK